MQLRNNQNSFMLTLRPVTIASAEAKGLGFFISSDSIDNDTRATAGEDMNMQRQQHSHGVS